MKNKIQLDCKLDYLNFNKKVKLQNQYLAKFARGTCAAF